MSGEKPSGPEGERPDASERIVAAAIRQDGVVFTGPHHHQIIRYMVPLLGIRTVTGEQGFITSRGRYVRRPEAAGIAFAAGQTVEPVGSLYSEQLWRVPDTSLAPPSPPAEPPASGPPGAPRWACPDCGLIWKDGGTHCNHSISVQNIREGLVELPDWEAAPPPAEAPASEPPDLRPEGMTEHARRRMAGSAPTWAEKQSGTPGPWYIRADHEDEDHAHIVTADGIPIALVEIGEDGGADAALIAAAPVVVQERDALRVKLHAAEERARLGERRLDSARAAMSQANDALESGTEETEAELLEKRRAAFERIQDEFEGVADLSPLERDLAQARERCEDATKQINALAFELSVANASLLEAREQAKRAEEERDRLRNGAQHFLETGDETEILAALAPAEASGRNAE